MSTLVKNIVKGTHHAKKSHEKTPRSPDTHFCTAPTFISEATAYKQDKSPFSGHVTALTECLLDGHFTLFYIIWGSACD